MPVEDLSPAEQLTFWVGAVTRAATELHADIRTVFAELVGDSPALVLIPSEVKRAAEMCSAMLGRVQTPHAWLVTEGRVALQAAVTANDERNRYVHDEIHPGPEEHRWVRHRLGTLRSPDTKVTEFDLDALKRCAESVFRASWRTAGLTFCLQDIANSDVEPEGLASSRAIMNGEFETLGGYPYRSIRLWRDPQWLGLSHPDL